MIWDRLYKKMNRFKSESMYNFSQFSMRIYWQRFNNELARTAFIPFDCKMGAEQLNQAENIMILAMKMNRFKCESMSIFS